MTDFKDHRDHICEIYRIPDAWRDLGLPGEPASYCLSPWRDESDPSFSIYDDGRKFKDHGTGEAGDVYEFVKISRDCEFKTAAQWIDDKAGVSALSAPATPRPKRKAIPKPKAIEWPGELLKCTEATWGAFAGRYRLTPDGVAKMVYTGLLRFTEAEGHKCFVVLDKARKAAEIRRIDRGKFRCTGKAQYGLKGCSKDWLAGGALLEIDRRNTPVFITEGATDFLAGVNALHLYKKAGGKRSWLPLSILGAGCRKIHPELAERLSGRLVRLAPDGDTPGDKMRDTWGELLHHLGCQVEILEMPRGRDLRDMLESGELKPEEVFA